MKTFKSQSIVFVFYQGIAVAKLKESSTKLAQIEHYISTRTRFSSTFLHLGNHCAKIVFTVLINMTLSIAKLIRIPFSLIQRYDNIKPWTESKISEVDTEMDFLGVSSLWMEISKLTVMYERTVIVAMFSLLNAGIILPILHLLGNVLLITTTTTLLITLLIRYNNRWLIY